MTTDLAPHRARIESALSFGDGSRNYEDVVQMVGEGRAIAWSAPHSVVVTETVLEPRKKSLHFFLAAGKMAELEIMTPHILAWAKAEGCSEATLAGRRGWARSFLARTGWKPLPLIIMHKDL